MSMDTGKSARGTRERERHDFERWLAGYICGSVGEIFGQRAPEGGYEDRAYDLAWAAWQARAATTSEGR